MSLTLSVLSDKRLSGAQLTSVCDFLLANGFRKGEYGYHAEADNISVDVYTDSDTETDEFWTDDPPDVVRFFPMTDIGLESRHNRESHEMNYRLAKELAGIIGGVIYDNQVGMVYDSDGKPLEYCRTGGRYDEYGSGAGLFLRGVSMFSDIIGKMTVQSNEAT